VFAGALIGYSGVNLDASIAMVFTVVFGIAIDDTIHFLSSFRLNQAKGESVEKALHTTMVETGKAVFLTTVILFFGFLVMLFSHHPPSIVVGKLISVTLLTALASDLLINPILIRAWIRDKEKN
jgi:predicted RND superfamily exporter protein